MADDQPIAVHASGRSAPGAKQRQIAGEGFGFSPDGRYLLVQDASKILRLVEAKSGRTVARLESPDSCGGAMAAFSPTARGWS